MGRIKRGGGDGGEPARSPPGRSSYADRMAARSRSAIEPRRRVGKTHEKEQRSRHAPPSNRQPINSRHAFSPSAHNLRLCAAESGAITVSAGWSQGALP